MNMVNEIKRTSNKKATDSQNSFTFKAEMQTNIFK